MVLPTLAIVPWPKRSATRNVPETWRSLTATLLPFHEAAADWTGQQRQPGIADFFPGEFKSASLPCADDRLVFLLIVTDQPYRFNGLVQRRDTQIVASGPADLGKGRVVSG